MVWSKGCLRRRERGCPRTFCDERRGHPRDSTLCNDRRHAEGASRPGAVAPAGRHYAPPERCRTGHPRHDAGHTRLHLRGQMAPPCPCPPMPRARKPDAGRATHPRARGRQASSHAPSDGRRVTVQSRLDVTPPPAPTLALALAPAPTKRTTPQSVVPHCDRWAANFSADDEPQRADIRQCLRRTHSHGRRRPDEFKHVLVAAAAPDGRHP